jgi:putative ABC transport system substrate-binding protein
MPFIAACERLPGRAPRVPRVGYSTSGAPAGDRVSQTTFQAFVAGLGGYGYIPEQNLQIESRFPTDQSQVPQMIGDLLQSGIDVLVTAGSLATQAAKQATSTVPIVGINVGDPLGTGLVQSLARPGGNVTVISQNSSGIVGKYVELLRQIEPALRRFAVLYTTGQPSQVTFWQQLSALANESGLEAVPAQVHTIADIDGAFETAAATGAEAFVVVSASQGAEGYAHIAALALSHRLVSEGLESRYAAAGGLLTYGADYVADGGRAGYLVDRILKGAKPADLPVEFPTTFELVVNRKTATALGIAIPEEVALQVTSWI